MVRIINEPTASALAYGLDKKKEEISLSMTLVAVLLTSPSSKWARALSRSSSTNGDTHLGGDDIDQRVQDWLVGEFKKESGIDLTRDKMALQRLKEAAEKAKMELSTTMETEINLPFITADASRAQAPDYEADPGQAGDDW